MAVYQVTCIKKDDRKSAYERISTLGGSNWQASSDDVITYIERGTHSFYVTKNGSHTDVVVAVRLGRKYLKTRADDSEPNNLLSLPECP
ncbi:DUF3892 domain-containing protein [Alcaligenaceae bacterium B3P038]|nr:DUF3892 domain-containing protein [Alcaligenaceae bacterium B3P038]